MKTTSLFAALAAAALIGAAPAAMAQSANFTQWTAAGDVTLNGITGATLSTAAQDSGETPLSASSALLYFALEPALSMVGATAGDTWEGSGLAQSFVAAAGTTISFNWTLSTVGYDAGFADRAFAVVDGAAAVDFATVGGSLQSGTYSYTFSTAGNHSLAIAVMDVNDVLGVSTLTVSNLTVSAVPEPASLALMFAGLGLVGAAARRQRRA